jgi:hypothetical protein
MLLEYRMPTVYVLIGNCHYQSTNIHIIEYKHILVLIHRTYMMIGGCSNYYPDAISFVPKHGPNSIMKSKLQCIPRKMRDFTIEVGTREIYVSTMPVTHKYRYDYDGRMRVCDDHYHNTDESFVGKRGVIIPYYECLSADRVFAYDLDLIRGCTEYGVNRMFFLIPDIRNYFLAPRKKFPRDVMIYMV